MVRQKSLMVFLLALLCLSLTTGCANAKPVLTEKEAAQLPTKLSAWVAYWDAENGIEEATKRQKDLTGLVYFAANFTQGTWLVVPAEVKTMQNKLAGKKYAEYLSIVNDVTEGEETLALKDAKIVLKVLDTPSARHKHIAELIALAQKQKVAGLEIDYENIWKEPHMTELFPLFVTELWQEAKAAKLKLRIVLEPSAPFAKLVLPQGPEYVVMLYNLYGVHSGPGPKADRQFIYNTVGKMATLPEPKGVALANGGCVWSNKAKARFITQKEALTLAKEQKKEPRRDEDSQAQVFKYRVGTTVKEVWYADDTTLKAWTLWAKQGKITNISLWRL